MSIVALKNILKVKNQAQSRSRPRLLPKFWASTDDYSKSIQGRRINLICIFFSFLQGIQKYRFQSDWIILNFQCYYRLIQISRLLDQKTRYFVLLNWLLVIKAVSHFIIFNYLINMHLYLHQQSCLVFELADSKKSISSNCLNLLEG